MILYSSTSKSSLTAAFVLIQLHTSIMYCHMSSVNIFPICFGSYIFYSCYIMQFGLVGPEQSDLYWTSLLNLTHSDLKLTLFKTMQLKLTFQPGPYICRHPNLQSLHRPPI